MRSRDTQRHSQTPHDRSKAKRRVERVINVVDDGLDELSDEEIDALFEASIERQIARHGELFLHVLAAYDFGRAARKAGQPAVRRRKPRNPGAGGPRPGSGR